MNCARALLMAPMLAFAGAGMAAPTLSADDLARASRALSSIAAETGFFLELCDRGELTAAYARIHLDKLAQRQRETAKKLERPAAPAIAGAAAQARALSAALGRRLQDLEGRLDDRAVTQSARQETARLAREFARLGAMT